MNLRQSSAFSKNNNLHHGMRGTITVFTCFMILLLMTTMLAYSSNTSMREQNQSANELRQKRALHMAEAGLNLAREWLVANNTLINADVENMLGSGLDGWMVAGSPRWVQCGDVDYASDKSHPCWGDPNESRRDQSYFYYWEGSTALPIDSTLVGAADGRVRVEALYCFIDLDLGVVTELLSPVLGCLTNPALVDGSKFLVTLLARGEVDCHNGVCGAEAMLSEQVSNFSISAKAKAPGVPLVTNGNFPDSGLLEVVSNPDGLGAGLPLSIWANNNTSCPGLPADLDTENFSTCSPLEWYGLELIPQDAACTLLDCSCPVDDLLDPIINPLLGPLVGVVDELGTDVLLDEAFPCDLFQFYFGIARGNYTSLRDSIQLIDDCSTLDENSAGAYWVTGAACIFNAGTVVGSAEHPVMLISAAELTQLQGGVELFGMLFLTDIENENAEFNTTGNATVFGSVVSDGVAGDLNGTFQVVYNDDIVADASVTGGLGAISGSWTDFHKEWQ
jgi:hypothetical protein